MENLPVLPFSYNWNNKLNCNCFSTIRIVNDKKYVVGSKWKVLCKGEDFGTVELAFSSKAQFQWLTEAHALIDTGYSLHQLKEVLQKMYPEYIKKYGKNALFGIYIFKKVTE